MSAVHPVIAQLKEERVTAGLSAPEVAKRIHISTQAMYGREKGHHEPVCLADVDRWAAVFGLRLALVPIEAETMNLLEAS